MDIFDLIVKVNRLESLRGDQELHHAEADDVAYGLLALLCTGHNVDEIRSVAEVVLEEDESTAWWYA